ncbi:MAG: hypothetical protein OEW92_11820 [Gammaproteobacteria bacterium]|jgi:hypothetical protein|nr:hypothetical protein [Gammaproteobacteria bacterium]MDH5173099.1 hypothetical protein [Gammaproteobacteria bacterium]
MFGRLVSIALIAAAAYWYWSGPYQEQRNPSADRKLQRAIEEMRQCVRGMNYQVGATGVGQGDPEQVCAKRFNLYYYEGEWRSSEEPPR